MAKRTRTGSSPQSRGLRAYPNSQMKAPAKMKAQIQKIPRRSRADSQKYGLMLRNLVLSLGLDFALPRPKRFQNPYFCLEFELPEGLSFHVRGTMSEAAPRNNQAMT